MNGAREPLRAAIAALESQRARLGDAVVELALAPLREQLRALDDVPQPAAQPAAAAEQQLKQVTVMFVDSVGSTAMARRLDPEDIHAILDGTLARYTALVREHGGRVLQYTGDGLLAAFGADGAREDDAERAVRAALAITAEARQRAAWVEREHGVAGFGVRVGLDTGPVLLGGGVDAEGSIRGAVVNRAARMEQTAPAGGIRIHHDTWRHVRGLFRFEDAEPLVVKGHEAPLHTHLVLGALPRGFHGATRGLDGVATRMIAREAELEALQEAWRALFQAPPRFGVATVVGDAGLGKSRLVHEFERWAAGQPQAACWLRGRAEPQTREQPFGLLRNLLLWDIGIAEEDAPHDARAKLVAALAPLLAERAPAGDDDAGAGAVADDDGTAGAHLVGQLIGLDFSDSPHVQALRDDARQLRNRAFHAAAQVVARRGERAGAPVVLLLDDVHWADDGSLDFLVYLAQVQRSRAGLMLCLARQTLFERRPDWALASSAPLRIELQPLDTRASRELALELLRGAEPVPPALRETVIAGAEGNPFYMEETVRMLVDDGAIVVEPDRDGTGAERWRVVAEKLLSAQVPSTLTGVLQARLDGLPAPEKRALQHAAVIGFVFWEHALAALDDEAVHALPALVERGLLVPRAAGALQGQREYAFKHQLLHQVTYDSVLKRQRRLLHARVAAWLAPQGSRGAEALGLAADHFERAGDAAEASAWFALAAEDAAARWANAAMLGFVERSLALARADDDDTRWRLVLLRERHRLAQGESAAHAADLEELARIAARSPAAGGRTAVLALRRAATLRRDGDFAGAEAVTRQTLQAARPVEAAPHAVALHHCLAASLIRQGRYAEARQVSEDGLALARARGERGWEAKLVSSLGLMAMEQGELSLAARHFEASLATARELGNRGDEGVMLSNLGSLYPRWGAYARARAVLEQGLKVARAVGQPATEAALLLNLASAAHLQGDDAAALAHAHAAGERADACGERDLVAFARMVTGHAELGLGRHAAARRAYADARSRLQALKMRPEHVLDAVSGLARVALAEGRVTEALMHVEQLLAHTSAGGHFDGTEEPLLLPLTAWRVLDAAGDPRAPEVLAEALAELQAQAERISDAAERRGFLEDVPHHAALMAARRPRRGEAAANT